MLRAARVALVAALALVSLAPATSGSATSAGCALKAQCPADPARSDEGVSAGATGGSLEVRVESSVVSAGRVVTSSARVVRAVPVCRYVFLATGADYAGWWAEDGWASQVQEQMPSQYRFEPFAGWQEHSADHQGGWYIPVCSSVSWADDDLAGFYEYATDYFAEHGPVFVEAGSRAPAGVTAQELVQVAVRHMDLPTGRIAWNPRVGEGGFTVVGVDTWVWVEDVPDAVSVTASVPDGTWARVDASLVGLEVSAPGAESGSCDGAGVVWTPSADERAACRVVFTRSSAGAPVKDGQVLPTVTMTATARWEASWVSSMDPTPGVLPVQEVRSTVEVPVGEIQTLVTYGD